MIPTPLRHMRPLPAWVSFAGFATLLASFTLSSCAPKQAGGGFKMPPVPVEVSEARAQTVRDQFRAVGTIESDEDVQIVSELDGTLRSMPFAEGQPVRKGDLIAQIDDRELKPEAERTEAQRELAEANYTRSQKLADQQAISQSELDDSKSAFRVADAAATVAKVRLEKSRIRAPFDGVVGRRLTTVGSWVRAGDPIAHVARLSTLRVAFSAPERMLSELRPGRAVDVRTPAWPGRVFEGHLSVVDPNVDPVTRTVHLIAQVPNPGALLRPGLSADVSVTLSERPGSITIPEEAVFAEGSANFVYVVKPDSSVTKVALQLGSRDSARVEVTHGLTAGQTVVRTGYQKIFEGAHVLPVSDAAALGAMMGGGGPGGGGAGAKAAGADSATAAATGTQAGAAAKPGAKPAAKSGAGAKPGKR